MAKEIKQEICAAPECGRVVYAKGYCNKHYTQIRTYGKLRPDLEREEYSHNAKECAESGCHGEAIAKGLCRAHYQKQYRSVSQADQVEDNMRELNANTPRVNTRRKVARRRRA